MENQKLTYRIDVDNTICRTNGNDYENAVPIFENISKINKLFEAGHIVIYWTARGGSSGKDWLLFTISQLTKWGAKFNSVQTGKPSFDFIVDDRAVKIEELQ